MFAWFHKVLMHQESGGSLVELVVVLAIIGILIALAMPRYMHLINVVRDLGAS